MCRERRGRTGSVGRLIIEHRRVLYAVGESKRNFGGRLSPPHVLRMHARALCQSLNFLYVARIILLSHRRPAGRGKNEKWIIYLVDTTSCPKSQIFNKNIKLNFRRTKLSKQHGFSTGSKRIYHNSNTLPLIKIIYYYWPFFVPAYVRGTKIVLHDPR